MISPRLHLFGHIHKSHGTTSDGVTVMLVKLEDDKTGMVELSKKRADDKIRRSRRLTNSHI